MEFVDASVNAQVARCGHFSLRGYVVEIRKKDRKQCWPFSVVDCPNSSEQQGHELPALDVTEFRWWGCPDCVRTLNGSVTGEVTNHCNDEYESISHSRKNVVLYGDAHNVYEPINHENACRSSDEDDPIQVSVPPRASREGNCEVKNDNLSVSTGLIHEAADTQEITNHSNNGHEPISHSQEIVAMSSHGYVLNLQPTTGYSDENTPRSSDGVAPVQLSVPPRASRENICEERYDDLCENTDLTYEAAETQETTNPSNNGHEPISHSQEIVVLSPHGYASNLVPITSHSNENTPTSCGDAPMQLTGSPKASRTDISEERNDEFSAIMNLNEAEKENLSLGDDRRDMEPATDQPRREDLCPFKGQGDDDGVEQSVNQAVQKATGAATTEMPCPTERTTDGFDATIMSTNNMQESNGNLHNSDTLDMCASRDEKASETVSHNKKSEKEKVKRMRGGASESYLEENLGFGRKKVVKMKKGFKTSGRERNMVNLDTDEYDEEFFENEHDNPSGISRPRKVQKVRTMKDILSSKTAVASSKSLVFSEDLNTDETNIEVVQSSEGHAGPVHKAPTHCGVWGGSDVQSEELRKKIVGVDLNLYLDSAMTVPEVDYMSSDKKGKRPIVQGRPLNNDEMVSSRKKKNKVPRVEDEKSRFMTWKEGSGFQIAKDDMQNTVLQLGGGNVAQAEHSSPQSDKPEASCLPRVSADIMYEHVTSDEMEVVALLAKHRHERHRSDAEGANRNSLDGYVSQPSKVFPTVSLSQPNYVLFGMNNHQRFVSGSRNVTRPSQPLERPPEKVIQRERELKYHQKSVGQLNLPANYVIPETDFLRLMVNSLCTSTSAYVDRRQNFGQRPLVPHEHQPQHQHKNGETSMRPVTWKFFDNSPAIQSQKTESRMPKLMFDAFKSQAKVPTKRKKAGPPQSRKSRLEKSVPGNANSSERLQIGEKLMSVPAPMTFGTQRQPIPSATPHRLDLSRTAGTEICSLNRNPADFSIPEKGNKYMIGYRELEPKKMVSAGNKRRRICMNVQ